MSSQPHNEDEPSYRQAVLILLAVAGACALLCFAVLWFVELG